MNLFCTKCNVNWAQVYTCDHNDESYDYCPGCGSDMDLIAGSGHTGAYIKTHLPGK